MSQLVNYDGVMPNTLEILFDMYRFEHDDLKKTGTGGISKIQLSR